MRFNTPEKGFIGDYSIYRKRKPSVTLVVKRNVVEPLLIRNSDPDRAETQEFGDQIHAQANGEKFVSKERLKGLDLLRDLDEDGELISSDYKYNEPEDLETSLNLDVFSYGLAGTGDQTFAFKSHVIEGYTYTTDEYDLMNKETRNAVYESGTMRDEDGEQSESLYEYVKVQPGNSFVHFITIESGTPQMLLYALHNVLNTEKYGARETRSGKNIDNEILGVILGDHSTSLSTGELLMNYDTEDVEEAVQKYLEDARKADWEIYSEDLDFDSFPDWFKEMKEVASLQAEDSREKLKEELKEFTEKAREVHNEA